MSSDRSRDPELEDRRTAEADALRESEARFRAMADGTPIMIWVTRADASVQFVNAAYLRFFGVTLEEVQSAGWQPLVHPEDLAQFADDFTRALAEHTPYHGIARVRRHDGEWRWIETFAQPRFSATGEFLGMAGSSPDVTEAREAERALREADRRKDDFLAILSHELRNPLAPIKTSLDVLRQAPPGSPTAERARQVLERQVAHMSHLVDDLLDVSRIARGKVQLQRSRVELGALVRCAVEDHSASLAAKALTVDLRLGGVCWIDADPTRITQVIGNLLHNASKFTPERGRVCVALEVEAPRAVLCVEDSGPGIPPELLAHVFEPFAQAEATLSRTQGGLGLGLALVKGLVELHGGSVQVSTSAFGTGARFTIALPIVEAPNTAVTATVAAPPNRRVLLIEDNVDAAEMLAELLRLSGQEVEVFHRGADGVERALVQPFDVVLCDVGLPDVSGFEVARTLKARLGAAAPRLVALTGYGLPSDVEAAKVSGFDHHLTKPANLDALFALLASDAGDGQLSVAATARAPRAAPARRSAS